MDISEGGKPLLHQNMFDFIELARNSDLDVELFTCSKVQNGGGVYTEEDVYPLSDLCSYFTIRCSQSYIYFREKFQREKASDFHSVMIRDSDYCMLDFLLDFL